MPILTRCPASAESYFSPAPASARFKRALRRLAALRWMMPRLAALSRAEMNMRICAASLVVEARARFCNVRSRVRTPRL